MTEDRPSPLIVGAGPTGLSAALFLAERGVRSRIVDRSPEPSRTSRAQVVNPRALELLEASGLTAAITAEGRAVHGVRFYEGWKPRALLDLHELPSRFAMTVLPQARTEALVAEALAERGIAIERQVAFEHFDEAGDGLHVRLRDPSGPQELVVPLLLGADGSNSGVRHAAGIAYEGHSYPEEWPLYDLELDDPLDDDHAHVNFVDGGLVFMLALRRGLWRIFGNVPDLIERLPPGSVAGAVEWESRFHVADKLADRVAKGRVALAGDAAHIHSPAGARGMNLGIEDAYVFAACAADLLAGDGGRLDDYGRLRHAVHKEVVTRMGRITTLARGRPGYMALLRDHLIPALTGFSPLAHLMQRFITGLEQPVRIA